uniref:Gibberellin 3-beta-dioxygenase 1 n=1 Tax=Tanacetum cinerariifolium TaxID=118510 RepID=A0A6L2LYD6_TANCI|nr:gibberellin 3-beta-dioxygenase 1 [Tanacetum cinerariifolium]
MEIGRLSRIDDEVVQDQRQRDDNDLQDERQDQPKEEDVEPRRSKRARTEKSFRPNFVSFMVENEPNSYREVANLDTSTSNVLIPLDSWTSGLLVYKEPLSKWVQMDDPTITMEEYIMLEEEKACRRGKVYNWKTATYESDKDNDDDKVDIEHTLGDLSVKPLPDVNLDNSTSNVLIPLDSWTSGLLVYKEPLSSKWDEVPPKSKNDMPFRDK